MGCPNSNLSSVGRLKMPQNSASKKTPKPPLNETSNSNPKRKRMGAEIDEIFAGKKKKKMKTQTKNKNEGDKQSKSGAISKPQERTKRVKGEGGKSSSIDNPFSDSMSKSRKKTGDGFTIYSEEELGIGKADAGGTSLCPFDCNCCF